MRIGYHPCLALWLIRHDCFGFGRFFCPAPVVIQQGDSVNISVTQVDASNESGGPGPTDAPFAEAPLPTDFRTLAGAEGAEADNAGASADQAGSGGMPSDTGVGGMLDVFA